MNKNGRLYFLFTVLLVIMAGCGHDPFFIPVESIDGVPSTGTTGVPLTLTGRVNPGFASKTSIDWLMDTGTTENNEITRISGNILYTNKERTVSIRAIVVDGVAEGRDYTEVFYIKFSKSTGSTSPLVFTSVDALKGWLNDQLSSPSPADPYFVKLNVDTLSSTSTTFPSNKYFNLDLSDSTFTVIPQDAFSSCKTLVGITIGSNVTKIEANAFNYNDDNLTSVTFKSLIYDADISNSGLPSGLLFVYQATGGGIGTYMKTGSTWTKK